LLSLFIFLFKFLVIFIANNVGFLLFLYNIFVFRQILVSYITYEILRTFLRYLAYFLKAAPYYLLIFLVIMFAKFNLRF